jgi:hypothetical protein
MRGALDLSLRRGFIVVTRLEHDGFLKVKGLSLFLSLSLSFSLSHHFTSLGARHPPSPEKTKRFSLPT